MRKNSAIDDALTRLESTLKPGETLSRSELAKACQCSHQYIAKLERQALRKAKEIAISYQLNSYLH